MSEKICKFCGVGDKFDRKDCENCGNNKFWGEDRT